jgi:catechol 2,3-dioxygenase-like lactoylglutathione lyase family enzyme
MVTKYHVNPRYRAYGKARIDIAQRAASREDWDRLWKAPLNPFPFTWGTRWKQNVEYKVDDFAAEVGFFIDVLGLPVIAFDANYAMFTSPDEDFTFSVVPAYAGEPGTPPDAIRIQFMVADILKTTGELQRRGIQFEQMPEPISPGSALYISSFSTPHGISIDLWGMMATQEREPLDQPAVPAVEEREAFQAETDEQTVPMYAASAGNGQAEKKASLPVRIDDQPTDPEHEQMDQEERSGGHEHIPDAQQTGEFELTYEDVEEDEETDDKVESPWKTNLMDSLEKFRGGRIRTKVAQRRLGN